MPYKHGCFPKQSTCLEASVCESKTSHRVFVTDEALWPSAQVARHSIFLESLVQLNWDEYKYKSGKYKWPQTFNFLRVGSN